jgi:hypothetical protein
MSGLYAVQRRRSEDASLAHAWASARVKVTAANAQQTKVGRTVQGCASFWTCYE